MNDINIKITSKESYVNKYNDQRINPKLNNYLLEESKGININKKITIIVDNQFTMTEEEKQQFIHMLKQNFKDDVIELKEINKRIFIADIIMFLLGIIFLLIYFIIGKYKIISEITLIIGWVFLWESIYNVIFSKTEKKIKIKKRKQLINSKIIFKN